MALGAQEKGRLILVELKQCSQKGGDIQGDTLRIRRILWGKKGKECILAEGKATANAEKHENKWSIKRKCRWWPCCCLSPALVNSCVSFGTLGSLPALPQHPGHPITALLILCRNAQHHWLVCISPLSFAPVSLWASYPWHKLGLNMVLRILSNHYSTQQSIEGRLGLILRTSSSEGVGAGLAFDDS